MHTTEKTTLFRFPRSPTLPLSLPTGAMELIRTPEAAHSIARLFVKLSTAALAAPVWLSRRGHDFFFFNKQEVYMCLDGAQWTLILTTCLESLSTCQQWCSLSHRHALSSMQCTLCLDRTTNNHMEHLNKCSELVLPVWGLPAWQQWNVPVRLVSITAFHPLEDMFSAGLLNWPPPLFTRKSILPCCFSTDDMRAFTCHTQGTKTRQHSEISLLWNGSGGWQCRYSHLILIPDVTLEGSDGSRAGWRDFLSHLLSCCLQPSCISAGDYYIAA